MAGSDEHIPVEERTIEDATLIRRVSDALDSDEKDEAVALVKDLRAPDLADLIELLAPESRIALIQALGPLFDFEVLSELEEGVRDQLSEALPNELLAKAITELDTDDAAYIIENLEQSDKDEILAHLTSSERVALERNLEYAEERRGASCKANSSPWRPIGRSVR